MTYFKTPLVMVLCYIIGSISEQNCSSVPRHDTETSNYTTVLSPYKQNKKLNLKRVEKLSLSSKFDLKGII